MKSFSFQHKICATKTKTAQVFFFFFFNTGVQIWNPKNKTKQKTLGHRNCFRVNVILIPNCMQRLGWTPCTCYSMDAFHTNIHIVFGKIRLFLFSIWGVKRKIPPPSSECKAFRWTSVLSFIWELALSASLNRSHTLTAAFDQAPRATAWSSKSEAYSEETADWDNWDSLVWGQQEWWESNREHWLHHIIVIMLPTEATEPSPVFAIGTDGLCAEAFILHVGSTYCFLDEAK